MSRSTAPARRVVAAVALAAVPAAVMVAEAAPAHAAGTAFSDPAHDASRFGDVVHVGVRNFDRVTVVLRFVERGSYADEDYAYLDTDPRHAGPEYAIEADTDAFGDDSTRTYVYRTDGWKLTKQVCHADNLVADSSGRHATITMSAPGRCITRPAGKVRVSVETLQYVGGKHDYAPARHRFSRWVRRG